MAVKKTEDGAKPQDKKPLEGKLKLLKIRINAPYDVCCEEVESCIDYKNFYILKHEGKYYHWLEKNLLDELKKDVRDRDKLKRVDGKIPITFPSDGAFKFDAIFKVVGGDINTEISIKVKDNSGKYKFKETKVSGKKTKGEKVEVKNIVCDDKPYNKTIQYIENFKLLFDITDNEGKPLLVNSADIPSFRLYITWKKIDTDKFSNDMVIPYIDFEAQKKISDNIVETLFWLGCKPAHGFGNNQSTEVENKIEILDKIFSSFETKKVYRAREGSYKLRNWNAVGLGYWRGISSVDAQRELPEKGKRPNKFYDKKLGFIDRAENLRKLVFLYGEFRCGEWAEFLQHILLCHSIESKRFHIVSGIGAMCFYKVSFNDSDPIRGFLLRFNEYDFLWNIEYKYNYTNWEFYVKGGWTFKDTDEPKLAESTSNRAQGNKNPRHRFMDHVIVIFDEGGKKKWYDPSYGIKSKKETFSSDKELLSDYALKAIDRIGYHNIFVNKYRTISERMQDRLVYKFLDGTELVTKGVIIYIDDNYKTLKKL